MVSNHVHGMCAMVAFCGMFVLQANSQGGGVNCHLLCEQLTEVYIGGNQVIFYPAAHCHADQLLTPTGMANAQCVNSAQQIVPELWNGSRACVQAGVPQKGVRNDDLGKIADLQAITRRYCQVRNDGTPPGP